MSELVHRYLYAVGTCLPQAKRDRVVAEVADKLNLQLEDRMTKVGRPLTEEDVADVLRAYGEPRIVAGRYAEHQYLIGPDLLPYYWYVLKVLIAISLGLQFLDAAVRGLAHSDAGAFWNSMATTWESPLWIVAIVTVLFVLIQRSGNGWPLRWEPARLPPIRTGAVSRFTSAFECVFNVALLMFIAIKLEHMDFARTLVWQPILTAVMVSAAIMAATVFATYIFPQLGRLRLAGQLAGYVASLFGIVVGLRAVDGADHVTAAALRIFLALLSIGAAIAVWRLFRPELSSKQWVPQV